MTPDEWLRVLDEQGPLGEVPSHIYLTLPRARLPRGERVRLTPQGGPLGRICNVREAARGFDVVALFDRDGVRQFMRRVRDGG